MIMSDHSSVLTAWIPRSRLPQESLLRGICFPKSHGARGLEVFPLHSGVSPAWGESSGEDETPQVQKLPQLISGALSATFATRGGCCGMASAHAKRD